MESESDPLTRRPVDLFEKEPLKGNSEVHLHTPTKFGEDRLKDLGGDREQTDRQTNRQTDKRCSIYSMISMHSFTVISSEENSAYFLQVQPITTCTVTTISFHQVPIGLSVQGQHWLETSTSTSIYDLWWDLLILNFMFFLISHNFHSYDCYSIMMTVMSRL